MLNDYFLAKEYTSKGCRLLDNGNSFLIATTKPTMLSNKPKHNERTSHLPSSFSNLQKLKFMPKLIVRTKEMYAVLNQARVKIVRRIFLINENKKYFLFESYLQALVSQNFLVLHMTISAFYPYSFFVATQLFLIESS